MKSDWLVGTTPRRSLLTPPAGYTSILKMESTDSLETLLAIRVTQKTVGNESSKFRPGLDRCIG